MSIELATPIIDLDRSYTVEEFMSLPDDDNRYELIRGKLVEMKGPSYRHGRITSRLFHYLDTFLAAHPIGEVLNNLAFELNPNNAPLPDLAFVAAERLVAADFDSAFPGPPDLAVEVVSRTDYIYKTDEKVEEYLKAGTRLVWVVNPRSEVVSVYHPGKLKPRVLDIEDELDGEDVLPGFRLAVKALFEQAPIKSL